MIRRPPRSTLFPTRRSSDLFATDLVSGANDDRFDNTLFLDVARWVGVFDTGDNNVTDASVAAAGTTVDANTRSEEHKAEPHAQPNATSRLATAKDKRSSVPL